MLYLAYGSNLNIANMAARCPRARKVGPLYLKNSRLVFRGVADIEYAKGEQTPGGLWQISDECEEALDWYEGVSTGLYSKVMLTAHIRSTNKIEKILVYQMNSEGIMPPDDAYLNRIARGYKDFGLDMKFLEAALQHSWGEKDKTPFLAKRKRARGNKPFAKEIRLSTSTSTVSPMRQRATNLLARKVSQSEKIRDKINEANG